MALSAAGSFDAELETTIYRIVQETLMNVVKHARASTVRVFIDQSDREVIIAVNDDRIGFDVGAPTAGHGLAGMRERVYLANGALELESTERGTRARIRLPARDSAE